MLSIDNSDIRYVYVWRLAAEDADNLYFYSAEEVQEYIRSSGKSCHAQRVLAIECQGVVYVIHIDKVLKNCQHIDKKRSDDEQLTETDI